MLGAASSTATDGDVALTERHYREAADLFGQAAGYVPAGHPGERLSYLDRQANALWRQGDERGDNPALRSSIEIYRRALEERTRDRVPLDWARTQMNLGTALESAWRARERDGAAGGGGRGLSGGAGGKDARSRAARLGDDADEPRHRAVDAWRARERDGAAGGGGRGVSRGAGGKDARSRAAPMGDDADEPRHRASDAWRARERDGAAGGGGRRPIARRWRKGRAIACRSNWAATQMNLGTALSRLGERESGTARLEEAVAAYRAALEERTRDRVPLQWAQTQNNLGIALWRLGERESGTARLEEAVAAYRAALEERTRDRVPLDWAMTQMNLGTALLRLGERESGTARLEEAVAAYRAALEERTRDRVPLDWAMTQMNLGTALLTLGERESGTARLEEAVAAYDGALDIFIAAGVDRYASICRGNRDIARADLGQRKR